MICGLQNEARKREVGQSAQFACVSFGGRITGRVFQMTRAARGEHEMTAYEGDEWFCELSGEYLCIFGSRELMESLLEKWNVTLEFSKPRYLCIYWLDQFILMLF